MRILIGVICALRAVLIPGQAYLLMNEQISPWRLPRLAIVQRWVAGLVERREAVASGLPAWESASVDVSVEYASSR